MKGKSKILLALALVVVSALCLYTACDKTPKTEVTITLGEKTEYELDLYEQVTLTATVRARRKKSYGRLRIPRSPRWREAWLRR